MPAIKIQKQHKKYPVYKDSGVGCLGRIPGTWRIEKLKHFSQISLGKMLQPLDSGKDMLKPYLRAQNINWEKVDVNDVREMWFSNAEIKKHRIQKGDLLVSEGGDVGRTAIWNQELRECYVQNSINRVTISDKNSARYLMYHFEAYGSLGLFEQVVNRVSIAHLTREKLKEIVFVLPPLDEQKKISEWLDEKAAVIDEVIVKKKRLVELLKEKRNATIFNAVTRGIENNVKLKDSGINWLGKIPEKWDVKKLKQIATIVTGGTPSKTESHNYFEEGVLWVKPNQLDEFKSINDSEEKISEKGMASMEIVPKGAVLTNCIGDIGKIGIAGVKLTTNQQINAVIFANQVLGEFGKYIIYSSKDVMNSVANKVVVSILNKSQQGNIYYPVPRSPDEQKKIAEWLDTKIVLIDDAIMKVEGSINNFLAYRQSLIFNTVVGHVCV